MRYRVAYATPLSGFPLSRLTSVNNFQLVPVDSPAALSPLLLRSETDESRGECERAGTELVRTPTEPWGCSSWLPASFWHPESLEVHRGHKGFLNVHPEHLDMDRGKTKGLLCV